MIKYALINGIKHILAEDGLEARCGQPGIYYVEEEGQALFKEIECEGCKHALQ
ncbi:hypothetical protein IHV09_22080 [Fictibacillus sp. 23RED33]|uniref:hypothetical protein n=1 Tax=Fictibacillus sp. 23RED33 TaxID=2745879 RepID=UPI0018CF873B|nr:hypothetical protein [Fictibacillus sp. 23RED33]MBH0176249.1 hypothetical protein [Fictibacillus sp. 23RED33]